MTDAVIVANAVNPDPSNCGEDVSTASAVAVAETSAGGKVSTAHIDATGENERRHIAITRLVGLDLFRFIIDSMKSSQQRYLTVSILVKCVLRTNTLRLEKEDGLTYLASIKAKLNFILCSKWSTKCDTQLCIHSNTLECVI